MIQLLRRYLRLMRTHDFSYWYSDDYDFFSRENRKRVEIIRLRKLLVLIRTGRLIVKRAEQRYGHV